MEFVMVEWVSNRHLWNPRHVAARLWLDDGDVCDLGGVVSV